METSKADASFGFTMAEEGRVRADFSVGNVVRAVVGVLLVGAKRLRHLPFVGSDPPVLRFVGLCRVWTERSPGRALTRMRWRVWPALDRLSCEGERQPGQPAPGRAPLSSNSNSRRLS